MWSEYEMVTQLVNKLRWHLHSNQLDCFVHSLFRKFSKSSDMKIAPALWTNYN